MAMTMNMIWKAEMARRMLVDWLLDLGRLGEGKNDEDEISVVKEENFELNTIRGSYMIADRPLNSVAPSPIAVQSSRIRLHMQSERMNHRKMLWYARPEQWFEGNKHMDMLLRLARKFEDGG
jgi:hypothetical protein